MQFSNENLTIMRKKASDNSVGKEAKSMVICRFMQALTHYQTTNFRLSKLKEFADDNFRFHENGKKLFKWVENTVGKGEIACYEQFLLFPQCFQKV